MAGPKGSKYYNVFLDYKFWLETKDGENVMGQGTQELIRQIKEEGSIQKAAEKTGISYRKAWGNIKKAEQLLGFSLVDKQRGGVGGGKTSISEEGEKLLAAFDELNAEFENAVHTIAKKFFHEINTSQTKEK
jgi:molybdate transport system regulatory protein